MLRPAGRARFSGKTLHVVSRGAEFIDKGAQVRIVQVDGNRYVVAPIKDGNTTEERHE